MINIRNLKSKVYKQAYDVVILAGEYGAVGFENGETEFIPDERIEELFRSESFNTRKNPQLPLRQYGLKKAGIKAHGMSDFYLFFGKKYVKEYLRPGRKLLFIRAAVSSGGFSDESWGRKDYLYLNMADMSKRIKLGNPENRIAAVLWHQGETDITNGADKEFYKKSLSALIRGIRFELNMPYLPFIAGDMSDEWCRQQKNSDEIREAIRETVIENDYCGFVSSEGLSVSIQGNIAYFSGKASEILGERYFEEYKKIREK